MIIALSSLHYSFDIKVAKPESYKGMDNEQEVSSIFSKLNVNAVEFVPSFGPSINAPVGFDSMTNTDPINDSESRQATEQPTEANGTGMSSEIT